MVFNSLVSHTYDIILPDLCFKFQHFVEVFLEYGGSVRQSIKTLFEPGVTDEFTPIFLENTQCFEASRQIRLSICVVQVIF